RDKKTNKKLTDHELVSIYDKEHPGLLQYYKTACSYVHFSNKHIFHTVSTLKDGELIEGLQGFIGSEEKYVPEKMRIEAAGSMINITKILLERLYFWTITKNHPGQQVVKKSPEIALKALN